MTPLEAMGRAIDVGRLGFGFVAPNPLVGCVIVDKNDQFLADGYHARYGGDHAEIAALKKIKNTNDLIGAKVYVTLEPCAHFGKTPPCAERLAGLPISEVIYGVVDPNPRVAGQGLEMLKKAGIRVSKFFELENELEELCEAFLKNMRRHLPFVSLKVATSLDGCLAMKSGESQWITAEAARAYGQRLRAGHDAVLIGVDTFLKDNPRLTCRLPEFAEQKARKVIVLDPQGRGLERWHGSLLAKSHEASNAIWVVADQDASPLERGPFIMSAPLVDKNKIDLHRLLEQLYKMSITSILVEGGARTLSAFLEAKAFDRVYQFISPTVMGSVDGKHWTEGLKLARLADRIAFAKGRWQEIGPDMLFTGLKAP